MAILLEPRSPLFWHKQKAPGLVGRLEEDGDRLCAGGCAAAWRGMKCLIALERFCALDKCSAIASIASPKRLEEDTVALSSTFLSASF